MHKNQIWLAFLASILLIALWFTGSTSYDLYLYTAHRKAAKPLSMTWTVQPQSSDRYYLKADYTFRVNEAIVEGSTPFDAFYYKNYQAAEKIISDYDRKPWTIWYNPSNPSSSSLQKFFPIKACAYTLVLWGLLSYFIWLGFYVGQYNMKTSVENEKNHS